MCFPCLWNNLDGSRRRRKGVFFHFWPHLQVLVLSRRVHPPWNPSAVGVQRSSSCLTMVGWAGVSLGGHGTLSGCSVSPAEPGCPLVCPAPPPFSLGSQRLWAEGCPSLLLQGWPGPPCSGAHHLPPLPHVLPFSSCLAPQASCRMPRLPALPGEADAGRGASWPRGGKGSWQGVLRELMAGHSSQQDVILSHPQPWGVEFHPLVYSRAEGTVRGQLLGKLSDQGGSSSSSPTNGNEGRGV